MSEGLRNKSIRTQTIHAGQHSDAPEAEAPEGEAESPAEETPPEDPALVEARDLYKQGEISFQTGELALDLQWKGSEFGGRIRVRKSDGRIVIELAAQGSHPTVISGLELVRR